MTKTIAIRLAMLAGILVAMLAPFAVASTPAAAAPKATTAPLAAPAACGSSVHAYAPYRRSGNQIWVNGTYNNCNGAFRKVCVYLNVLLVAPPNVQWAPLANKCYNVSQSPNSGTFPAVGTYDQYAQFVGIMIGYDGAGRQVASHTGAVAAV